MDLAYNQAQYQGALATKNNWFPGHTIQTFEFVVTKTQLMTREAIQKEAEKQGLKGEVIGVVLIKYGQPVKKTTAKKASVKASK